MLELRTRLIDLSTSLFHGRHGLPDLRLNEGGGGEPRIGLFDRCMRGRRFGIGCVDVLLRELTARYPINVTHFYMRNAMNTRFGIEVARA